MRFIRKGGHIIPIRDARDTQRKTDYKGLATGVAGAAISVSGSTHVGHILSKLGPKFKLAGMLGTVFAGEAIASQGFDKFNESLGLKKKNEQRLKNVTAGTLGVLGALAAIRSSSGAAKLAGKAVTALKSRSQIQLTKKASSFLGKAGPYSKRAEQFSKAAATYAKSPAPDAAQKIARFRARSAHAAKRAAQAQALGQRIGQQAQNY